ncbi:MAG: permease [Saccharofermentans sp.]|nr:permease [Saccharofermentans sp.]
MSILFDKLSFVIKAAETKIFGLSGVTLVLFFVFAIILLGYLVGKINIKGVTLGSAAIFIVALFAGHFKGVTIGYEGHEGAIAGWAEKLASVDAYFKLIQNLGLVFFVAAVGLIAGPTFFSNLKKNFKSYIVLGLIIILSGCGVTALIIKFTGMTSAMGTGLLSGALTSTPAFAAAQAALADSPVYSEIAVGHAVAYPFGVIGVVLFVQLMPKFLKCDMAKERALLVSTDASKDAKKDSGLIEIEKWGLAPLAITVVFGLILGGITIPLGKTASFSLGATGGALIMGLIVGHFGRIGKLSLKVPSDVLGLLQELGLIMFLIGAGVDGGAAFVDTLKAQGAMLFVWGAVMTLVPLICGFLFAKFVVKLSMLNNLGSLTGGMTSTPALGALIKVAGTSDVASAYAATYPIALVTIVLLTQFLCML